MPAWIYLSHGENDMSETKSVIEIIKRNYIVSGSDQHIAEITGQKYIRKPDYFRNTETGAEYSHISGGIGWPGERPGFAVVVAVEKDEDTLYVLAEIEVFKCSGTALRSA